MYVCLILAYINVCDDLRKTSPIRESLVLHIDSLTRNVNEGHLQEIFSMLFFFRSFKDTNYLPLVLLFL